MFSTEIKNKNVHFLLDHNKTLPPLYLAKQRIDIIPPIVHGKSMEFLKWHWWKLLPFVLFLFGVWGILAFTALLIMYLAFHAASSFPVNPKRGKFLTWLIVLEALVLVALIVSGFVIDRLWWIGVVLLSLEAVCLVGIWQWKKAAAISLLGLFTVHFAITIVKSAFNPRYPATLESTISLWVFVAILVTWLGLWVKALKQKWMFFT